MQKWWSILFAVVVLASLGLFIVAPAVNWWLPTNYCSYGPQVDGLFYLILGITGFFFILTEGILVYNLWSFGYDSTRRSEYTHGSHRLEMLWSAVPAVILLFIAFAQVSAWAQIKYTARMPAPDQVFEVSARQFEWRVRYPNPETLDTLTNDEAWRNPRQAENAVDHWVKNKNADDIVRVNEIHIWKNEKDASGNENGKVRIYLKTRDVLHSFFLPNLRVKQDAVPGKTIPVWFDSQESNYQYDPATGTWKETETWELACAELCGWGHYKMRGKLYVHETKEDFIRWLRHAAAEQNTTTARQE